VEGGDLRSGEFQDGYAVCVDPFSMISPSRRLSDLLAQLRDADEVTRVRLVDAINEALVDMRAPGDDHGEMQLLLLALEDGDLDGLQGSDGQCSRDVAVKTLEALGCPESITSSGACRAQHVRHLRWSRWVMLLSQSALGVFVVIEALSLLGQGRTKMAMVGLLAVAVATLPWIYLLMRRTPIEGQSVPMAIAAMSFIPGGIFALDTRMLAAGVLAIWAAFGSFFAFGWQDQEPRWKDGPRWF